MRDYLLAEYEAAQARLLQTGHHLQKIEMSLPVALALFYAWVWSQELPEGPLYRALMLIPVALVLAAWLRHSAEKRFMKRVAAYVEILEGAMFDEEPAVLQRAGGFEKFYNAQKDPPFQLPKSRDPFALFSMLYWALLLGGPVILAFWMPALWPPS